MSGVTNVAILATFQSSSYCGETTPMSCSVCTAIPLREVSGLRTDDARLRAFSSDNCNHISPASNIVIVDGMQALAGFKFRSSWAKASRSLRAERNGGGGCGTRCAYIVATQIQSKSSCEHVSYLPDFALILSTIRIHCLLSMQVLAFESLN